MEDHLAEYFNVEPLDTAKYYDVKSTTVVVDYHDFVSGNAHDELALRDRGLRLIIDKCWDCWDGHLDFAADYTLRPRDFIRWHESMWYTALGYNKPIVHNPTRDFILLMHLRKQWRDDLYYRFRDLLDNNIYSYIGNGVTLQNATDAPYDEKWQRHVNPDWYTDTRFSLVSESTVKDISLTDQSRNWVNVSEKIYKPMAFEHPYIVYGQQGTLAEMQRQGFETFAHVIDESYDSESDESIRLEMLYKQAKNIIDNKEMFTDRETLRILKHNKEHFFDENIVKQLFVEQLVNPLMEYLEQ